MRKLKALLSLYALSAILVVGFLLDLLFNVEYAVTLHWYQYAQYRLLCFCLAVLPLPSLWFALNEVEKLPDDDHLTKPKMATIALALALSVIAKLYAQEPIDRYYSRVAEQNSADRKSNREFADQEEQQPSSSAVL